MIDEYTQKLEAMHQYHRLSEKEIDLIRSIINTGKAALSVDIDSHGPPHLVKLYNDSEEVRFEFFHPNQKSY